MSVVGVRRQSPGVPYGSEECRAVITCDQGGRPNWAPQPARELVDEASRRTLGLSCPSVGCGGVTVTAGVLAEAERILSSRAEGDERPDHHGHQDRPPLDVLIVASEAPPIVSGISRCIDRLDRGLRARGATVEVVSAVQMKRLKLGEWRFSSFAAHWPVLARRLRSVDVVNVHGPVPTLSDLFLRLVDTLPSHARPAVVYTYHSPIDIRGVSSLCRAYNNVHGGLARRADTIVASSRHYAEAHTSRYGPVVEAIPWGVDAFPPGVPVSRRGNGPLRVLFVGQMRAYKGVDVLLQAVAGITDIELTLVGGGPQLAEYRSRARQVGAHNARFVGRLSDGDLTAEYGRNDVIVLPSLNRAEAFGLVLLEGMAAGCVPVASDLPGVRDVAERTGIVVPPGDADGLRRELVALATDRVRVIRLQQESELVAAQLSWDSCVDAYYDVFVSAARHRYRRLHGHIHPRFERLAG